MTGRGRLPLSRILAHHQNPSRETDYNQPVARRNRTGMERVGPSCSRQQCAAPPSAPRIKLKNGLTAPRNTDLGERPHPIFPHAPASPKETRKLKTSCRCYRADQGVCGFFRPDMSEN